MLTPDHELSPAVAEAIGEARAAGLRVFCATGRARAGPWVDDILRPLDLTAPGVFTQGLTAFDEDDNRICDATLDSSVLRAVQQVCQGDNTVTMAAYCREQLVSPKLDRRTDRYAAYGEAAPELTGASGDTWQLAEAVGDRPVNKLLLLASVDDVATLHRKLQRALRFLPCRVVRALDWTLEILPARTSKAHGVRAVLASLGIKPERCMAVGDGENDLELLKMVGLGVAMGNAMPAVKRAVPTVTAANDADGVAVAIRELALVDEPIPRRGARFIRRARRRLQLRMSCAPADP